MKHWLQIICQKGILLLLLSSNWWNSGPLLAQVILSPARNGYVARTGTISAGFPGLLKASSRSALRVFSAQRGGKKAGSGQVAGGQVSFTPTTGFVAGETVWVTLHKAGVYDTTQTPLLSQSQVWQFTASATPSSGQLTPQTMLDQAKQPHVITTGDIDNDGDIDILATYDSGNYNSTITTRLNDGTGTFYAVADRVLPYVATALSLGDIDGDGDLDMLALGTNPSTVSSSGYYSVFVNQGNGGLSGGAALNLGSAPTSPLSLVDIDGDSDLDMVFSLSRPSGSVVRVYLNTQGTFNIATTPTNTFGTNAAVGDLDNDGDLDVLALDSYSGSTNKLAVRLNDGSGTLSVATSSVIADAPQDLRLADVDGDGDLDALTTHNPYTGSSVRVWLNQGNALFIAGTTLSVPNLVLSLTSADLDGDGDQDLLYSYKGEHLVSAFNTGMGVFPTSTDQVLAVNDARTLATVDADADGDLDVLAGVLFSTSRTAVLVLRNGPAPAAPYAVASVAPLTNRMAPRTASVAATFPAAMSSASASALRVAGSSSQGRVMGTVSVAGNTVALVPTTGYHPGEVVSATISKTARDVAGVPLARPYVWQFVAATTGGTGQFTAGATVPFRATNYPLCVRLADLDGDHDLDIVTSFWATSSYQDTLLSVQRNDGHGNFTAPAPLLGTGISAGRFELADVDGDGDLDFLGDAQFYTPTSTFGTSAGRVWLNNGQGTFTAQGIIDNPLTGSTNGHYAWAAGDLDGDGDLDLMNGGVRLNDGQGNFYGGGELPAARYLRGNILVDLDNDGDLDCVSSSDGSRDYFVHLNDGTGYLTTGVALGANAFTSDVLVRDMDNDGDADIVTYDYSYAALWLNNGQGSFTKSPLPTTGYQPPFGFPLAVGDVDSDGQPDLLTTTGCYLNTGQGLFQAVSSQTTAATSNVLGALGDLDGDGDLDYVAVYQVGRVGWRVYFNAGRTLAVAAPTAAPSAVWPNPVLAGSQLYVSLPAAKPATLTLRTLLGQLIWHQQVTGPTAVVPVGRLAAGVYLLTLQLAGEPQTTQRVVIE